ncbi:hypothetical protein Gpo141_00002173 [Globisporangium polare]
MADVLMNLIEQTPASSLAVGGALVAAAVGFTAVKAFGGGKAAPVSADASAQKKKKKTKTVKKKAEVDQAPGKQAEATPEINLDDFVSNDPDTEDEEAARAEKKKLKRKLKKKNASIKAKTTASASASDAETGSDKKRAAAAAAAAKKDAEDGWETVIHKKAPKSKQN